MYRRRCRRISELRIYSLWNEDVIEEPRQDFDVIDKSQIDKRAGVSHNQPHLKAQAVQAAALPIGVFLCVFDPDVVRFQETIKLVTRLDPKEPP